MIAQPVSKVETACGVTLCHDPEQLAGLQTEWTALQESSATQTIFMTWEWVTTWWAHFSHKGQLWLMIARDSSNHRLIGLAPLIRVKQSLVRGLGWRQLEFIGTSSDCDHIDFIIEGGQEQLVITAFLQTLNQHVSEWDVLYLYGIPSHSPNLAPLRASGLAWQEEVANICPAIQLPQTWDDFFKLLSSSKRWQQRRTRRDLDAAYPDQWKWERVTDAILARETMDDMIRLHQAKWTDRGAAGGFGDIQTVAFHQAVAQKLLERNWLWLYRLYIGDKLAAIEYSYAYRGRVYYFASGLNFEWSEYSPGQLLKEIVIHEAVDAHMQWYDFLRGEEEYKFRWGAQPQSDMVLRHVVRRHVLLQEQLVSWMRAKWADIKRFLPVQWRKRIVKLFKREQNHID